MRRRPTSVAASKVAASSTSVDKSDTDTRVQAYDEVWVKHIKAALMENRFRLVQQPIASLHGDDRGMFDVLVRMVDAQGKEVLPSEFMPAAERNDLLKKIDRWVVGASSRSARARKPSCLFVRLSKDTRHRQVPRHLARQSAEGEQGRARAHLLSGDRGHGRDNTSCRRAK